jgi:hypothetical protein
MVDFPRIPMACGGGIIEDLEFQRRQFPVRVAFAMTINKAQDQSFDRVGLILQLEVFSHGQLYVACSRVTSPEGITMVFARHRCSACGQVRNIVRRYCRSKKLSFCAAILNANHVSFSRFPGVMLCFLRSFDFAVKLGDRSEALWTPGL